MLRLYLRDFEKEDYNLQLIFEKLKNGKRDD